MITLLWPVFASALAVSPVAQNQDPAGTDLVAGANSFDVHQQANLPGLATPGTSKPESGSKSSPSSPADPVGDVPLCETGRIFDCLPAPMCELPSGDVLVFFDGQVHTNLGPSDKCASAPKGAVNLAALVLRAFQRVPLPVSELSIQPPKGKTLVGLETIFSTKAAPFTKTLTLLNRQVQLRIRPARFVWHHGDGTTQQTDWAGNVWDHDSPDIDGYITHVFEHAGTVRPSVEVTWEADYRVGTGAWQPVNGTVTRQGPATRLRIVEGQPVLNGY